MYLCNRNPTTAVQGKTPFEAETSKEGSEKEPVIKDFDTEYVQLECSNEDNNENSHEEDQQKLQQQVSPYCNSAAFI